MEVASGLAGGTLMTVAGQTMLAVTGQSMSDAPSVIIIGAGISGIAMAHKLKHGLGFSDFTIYEKSDDVGGFNKAQTESRCSYPNLLYSFSFHQNYHWQHEYASEAEAAAYMQDTVTRFDLAEHIHTGVEIIKANWIDDKNTWCVRLRDLNSGHEYNRYCTILISAAGPVEAHNDFERSSRTADEALSMSISVMDDYVPLARRMRRTMAREKKAGHTGIDYSVSQSDDKSTHDNIEIVGARDGVSLAQYWKETRGPQAYWGCLVASFPNFGLVAGPLTLAPDGSPFSAIEFCVSYLSRNLVAPVLDNRAARVEVRQAVEDRWMKSLRHKFAARSEAQTSPSGIHSLYAAQVLYLRRLLFGSRGLVYKNGQTAWWMNTFVRWTKSIRLRTWLVLLLGVALLRVKSVKSRVDRARADVEKYVPYEKQALELAGKLKETVMK